MALYWPNTSIFYILLCNLSFSIYYIGGGDTGVPISHIPDFLPPNIPYPRFFYPQYPISQIFYPPISHIPDFTVN